MAEYTYKDVIIDPKDPRVEFGAEYYRADFPKWVVDIANNDRNYFGVLESIDTKNPQTPFVVKTGSDCNSWACIIRKKELSYAKRQEKWIKENDLKIGDLVRVTREAEDDEDGWGISWAKGMSTFVGNLANVKNIDEPFGILLSNGNVSYFFPYFVLEKVELKYVPFDLSKEEDRAKLRGAWIKYKFTSGYEYQIIAVNTDRLFVYRDEHTPASLLEKCLFLDGTPCGKLEVEDAKRV